MKEFFILKSAIGELKQDDLVNICELGQGNGGVVWKVRHKPTHKIMARKVCSLKLIQIRNQQKFRNLESFGLFILKCYLQLRKSLTSTVSSLSNRELIESRNI